MGDSLEFLSAKFHLIKNDDVVRRFCRALQGSVCLEEKIDCRRVSVPFHYNTQSVFADRFRSVIASRDVSAAHDVPSKGKGIDSTYILFPW